MRCCEPGLHALVAIYASRRPGCRVVRRLRTLFVNKNENKTHKDRAALRRSFEPPQADVSMRFFRMQELWQLARNLPIKKVRLSELEGFDEVHWFGGGMNIQPTCRAIAQHARDIYQADLSYPIILSPTGEVLDGWHRICKAFLQGIEELEVIQLQTMPAYRWRILPTGEELEILDEVNEL